MRLDPVRRQRPAVDGRVVDVPRELACGSGPRPRRGHRTAEAPHPVVVLGGCGFRVLGHLLTVHVEHEPVRAERHGHLVPLPVVVGLGGGRDHRPVRVHAGVQSTVGTHPQVPVRSAGPAARVAAEAEDPAAGRGGGSDPGLGGEALGAELLLRGGREAGGLRGVGPGEAGRLGRPLHGALDRSGDLAVGLQRGTTRDIDQAGVERAHAPVVRRSVLEHRARVPGRPGASRRGHLHRGRGDRTPGRVRHHDLVAVLLAGLGGGVGVSHARAVVEPVPPLDLTDRLGGVPVSDDAVGEILVVLVGRCRPRETDRAAAVRGGGQAHVDPTRGGAHRVGRLRAGGEPDQALLALAVDPGELTPHDHVVARSLGGPCRLVLTGVGAPLQVGEPVEHARGRVAGEVEVLVPRAAQHPGGLLAEGVGAVERAGIAVGELAEGLAVVGVVGHVHGPGVGHDVVGVTVAVLEPLDAAIRPGGLEGPLEVGVAQPGPAGAVDVLAVGGQRGDAAVAHAVAHGGADLPRLEAAVRRRERTHARARVRGVVEPLEVAADHDLAPVRGDDHGVHRTVRDGRPGAQLTAAGVDGREPTARLVAHGTEPAAEVDGLPVGDDGVDPRVGDRPEVRVHRARRRVECSDPVARLPVDLGERPAEIEQLAVGARRDGLDHPVRRGRELLDQLAGVEPVGEDVGARGLLLSDSGARGTGRGELTHGVDRVADHFLVPHHAVDLNGRQRVRGDGGWCAGVRRVRRGGVRVGRRRRQRTDDQEQAAGGDKDLFHAVTSEVVVSGAGLRAGGQRSAPSPRARPENTAAGSVAR